MKPRKGTNLVITAGNSFRSDDGVGPYLYTLLKGCSGLTVIDAGYTPENIVDEAIGINPDYIVVIDAADFQGRPGEIRIVSDDLIPTSTLSTHAIPLNVITRLIEESTGAATVFIGIQVRSVMMGEGLSPEVQAAAELLSQEIINFYNHSTSGRAWMHEMHLIKDLHKDLLDLAAQQNAAKVTKVYLRMGEYTEINEDILRFFFAEQGQGTPLEGADIILEKSPTRELRLVSFDCE